MTSSKRKRVLDLHDDNSRRALERCVAAVVQDGIRDLRGLLAGLVARRKAFDRDTDQGIPGEQQAQTLARYPRLVELMSVPGRSYTVDANVRFWHLASIQMVCADTARHTVQYLISH